jgi:APA family basic amino acid/polyamine antiporter
MAELPRRLGTGTATLVVVANTIGAGIFTTTGLMLAELASPALVLACWLLGGLIALAGALCYAELATRMPRAGAEYVYLREIYGPLPAFLTGWTSFFVGFSAPTAAVAVAGAAYLAAAGLLPKSWLAQKAAALAVILLLTAVHYRGVRLGARVQNALTGLNLTLLVGFVVAGFAFGEGSGSALASTDAFSPAGRPERLGLALLWVMFAYSGWNAAAYLAEEVEQPARTLPRALAGGTLIVLAVYLGVNLLFFYAAPAAALTGVVPVGEVAAAHLFGPGVAVWVAGLISLALVSSLSAYLFTGPRVYFAMARDGLFFGFAARLDPRFETPGLAILAQGACAAVMAVSGTFEQLLTYIGFALGIFPWLAVAGLFRLRLPAAGRAAPEPFYRVWGYPFVPLFYLAAMAAILAVAFWNRPGPSLVALATVAAGVPLYALTVGRRPRAKI